MKVEIIPVTASKQQDIVTLQEIATKSFTAMFGPYHEPQAVKTYTDETYALPVLIRELNDPDSRTYFLKLNDTPVGYLKLNWRMAQTDQVFENAMQLQRIYLLPEYWNQHLGSYLMDKALDEAKKSRVKTVWLGVWEHNDRARHFYERYGFKKAGSHTFVIGQDRQTYYWYALQLDE
ncbi:GNAT family N-acetyltransferase [uncultured Limosilactobacillus sp.]|uniref:GNAT family N-acetyltransferase n=1 Tax=uncultured Limosilactobacillus sp. TaxID=2837629 RepID=UPI0025E2744C|nr:GNAT family N-acetyltransferase [uncultured Limosilactobacillus sp.]